MPQVFTVEGFTYPRKSSDYLVELESDRADGKARLVGVLDTIGRPNQRPLTRWVQQTADELQELLEDPSLSGIEGLDRALCGFMVDRNASIRQLNTDNLPVFGFCVLFALCLDGEIRLRWLGDCRAYCLTPTRARKGMLSACEVRCPTPGHNQLHDEVAKAEDEREEPLELFKSELLELSRQLTCYWGMSSRESCEDVLADQQACWTPREGEALLLATDGFFLPMVRVAASEAGFRLNTDRLYLESWLERTLVEQELPCDKDHPPDWMEAVRELRKGCLQIMTRRKRYRDDMAVALIEPAE